MPKPIIVITVANLPKNKLREFRDGISEELKKEYHIIGVSGDTNNIQVFFEKDQIELNKEKLEELLSLSI